MPSFPTSPHTFTNFSNSALSDAAQVTDIYGEVEAIEAGLLNGTARLNSSNSTVANLSVTGGSTFGGAITFSTGVTLSTGTLTLNQGQVVFPAAQVGSASTRTLDDYREGTWTASDGSGAGLTITNSGVGQYIKIGRQVFVSMYVTYPATANGANAKIAGLPFVSANINGFSLAVALNGRNGEVLPNIDADTTTMTFAANNGASLTNANMSGVALRASGCYLASS
jgi:hypothetical protein